MKRNDYWIFGYGSLIWNPGFEYAERRLARLDGYQRRFGLYSYHYRGTRAAPGLVLGLDWQPGTHCIGVAFRVAPDQAQATRAYVNARELVSRAYFETLNPVELLCPGLDQGARVGAICYILDRTHEQYAGALDLETQADIIASRAGKSGKNADYLHNTVAHLDELGIEDPALRQLDRMVRARTAG